MKRLLTTTIVLLTCTATCSACWFPFFPTYSAGYGWGGRSCGYPAYPSYGYRGYAPGGYGYSPGFSGGCANGSCGVPYSANYVGYNSGCCNTCGVSSCSGSCNTCGVTGCSANCLPSGVISSDPTPDPVGGKTFADPDPDSGYDSDRRDRDLDRDFGGSGIDRDPPRPRGSSRPGGARDPDDDFGVDNSRWTPNGGGDSSTDSNEMFRESNRPAIDDERTFGGSDGEVPGTGGTGTGTGTDPDGGVIDHNTNRPPISDPLEGEDGATEGTTPGENTPAEAESEDPDTDSGDVLPPEPPSAFAPRTRMIFASQSATRSNVHDVLRPGFTRRVPTSDSTRLSSSNGKQRAPRWISVPMPAGRVRL